MKHFLFISQVSTLPAASPSASSTTLDSNSSDGIELLGTKTFTSNSLETPPPPPHHDAAGTTTQPPPSHHHAGPDHNPEHSEKRIVTQVSRKIFVLADRCGLIIVLQVNPLYVSRSFYYFGHLPVVRANLKITAIHEKIWAPIATGVTIETMIILISFII
jgi:hypothetical protein